MHRFPILRRTTKFTAIAIATAIVSAVAIYAYWAEVDYRLTTITPDRVYQSAAMPPNDLLRIAKKHGIQTVIDFRDDSEATAIVNEQAALRNVGIKHVSIPSSLNPPQETVDRFIAAMRQEVAAGQRVLLHCHHGEGRAVLYSALYRIEFEGWDNEHAYRGSVRLPAMLMFLSKPFPSLARLSKSNAKTRIIRDYRAQNTKSPTVQYAMSALLENESH